MGLAGIATTTLPTGTLTADKPYAPGGRTRNSIKGNHVEEEAQYLPELPPGVHPDDDPYILDLGPSEFTAEPFKARRLRGVPRRSDPTLITVGSHPSDVGKSRTPFKIAVDLNLTCAQHVTSTAELSKPGLDQKIIVYNLIEIL